MAWFLIHVLDSNDPARGVLVRSWNDIQAMENRAPNLQQLIDVDEKIEDGLVSVPEGKTIVAYLYVVDEDNLHDKQQYTINVISEEQYTSGKYSISQ